MKREDVREELIKKGFSRVRFGTDGDIHYIIAALPYPVSGIPPATGALLAPFAQTNYYGIAVTLLKEFLKDVCKETQWHRSEMRIFCNSPLPEKRWAVASGLGFIGKNSLIITPEAGSLCVLAGVCLLENQRTDPPVDARCGGCRRCESACPVKAITPKGFLVERCIQNYTLREEKLPQAILDNWGRRLYGCQICQEVCPLNIQKAWKTPLQMGYLGGSIPIRTFLLSDDAELRFYFKKSVLGQQWIPTSALRRNAILASRYEMTPELKVIIAGYLQSPVNFLRQAAEYVLSKDTPINPF